MSKTQRKKTKSRTLWFDAYYSVIQSEFMVTYLRLLINEEEKYRMKYADICEYKKNDIKKIAYRNDKKSVFDSVQMWNKYAEDIIENGVGMPKFIYIDQIQRDNLFKWDAWYYFQPGTYVKINTNKYVIISNDIDNQTLIVDIQGNKQVFKYEDVEGRIRDLLAMDKSKLKQINKSRITHDYTIK